MKVQSIYKENIVVDDGKHQEDLCEGFVNQMVETGEEIIRIGFQNINEIKEKITASHDVFDVIDEKEIDIMGIAEINVNWMDKVKHEAQLVAKMRFVLGQMVASS